MTKIFISYAHEDLSVARDLYNQLKSIGNFEPWFDKESLLPGMKWRPAIRKAIRESDFFISLLSQHSTTKRGFINKEMKMALEILDEFPEDQIFLVPIRLEECNPPDSITELQYVDLFPDWEKGLKKVLKVISKTPQINNKKKVSVLSGYEYRCGIVDLDGGLVNLTHIAKRLNSIQNFFHFTCPSITLSHNAIRSYEGSSNLLVNLIPESLYEQRKYLNVDLVACLTKYPLAFEDGSHVKFNYFAGPSSIDERFMFISIHSLYEFVKKANVTFEKGIAFMITSQLLVYFTELRYHAETRGCPMDFCEIRSDIVRGLKDKKLCHQCLKRIQNAPLKKAVEAILADEIKV